MACVSAARLICHDLHVQFVSLSVLCVVCVQVGLSLSVLGMLNKVRKFELRIKHSNSDSFSDPSIFVC